MIERRASPGPLSRLVMAGGAVGALAGPVRAEDFALSPGLQLVGWFGDDRIRFGIGLDVRAAWITDGKDGFCVDRRSGGIGVFAQAMWMFGSARFAAGLHGGHEVGTEQIYPSWDVEAGWTYRTAEPGHPSGHGLHLGAFYTLELIDLSARAALTFSDHGLIGEGAFGTGLRFPGPFHWGGYGVCSIGRPLRVDGATCLPGVSLGGPHPRTHRLDASTRSALAAAWLDDARGEAASVPAFEILASDLRTLDAPTSLVRAALQAARDEVRHTRMCSTLTSRLAGIALSPIAIPPERPERATLERLVIESWRDGCLAEGAAAARAAHAARRALEPDTRDVQRRIARDEAGHAELAWDVIRFALAAEPRMRDVLDRELESPGPETPTAALTNDCPDGAWQAHGRLTNHESDLLGRENADRARRRARALLAGARA